MISGKNKTMAFLISLILSMVSWGIVVFNVILRVSTLFQYGVYNIDGFGFVFVTILLSIYTLLILFKFSNSAYFPILLMLLHMAAMRGSTLIVPFIIADLAILLLLNTGPSIQTNHSSSQRTYYYSTFGSDKPSSKSEPITSSSSKIKEQDVFDAEYTTKD
ncbi:hypothetical protein [Mycoplasma sp. P36-A1]|uniref:hypothetical protein n=1 Tax=Mycoplasma sp. P36-A1 TaxID=3252900 RepID=UPI003C2FD9FC